jgi:hypothetical protein
MYFIQIAVCVDIDLNELYHVLKTLSFMIRQSFYLNKICCYFFGVFLHFFNPVLIIHTFKRI